ncbi:tellurite resistance/C4-dicarboxylate transporter family protein [Lentzea sp.]|uniref:tellurite resistance/C4-dicarboxylate transporter family protein n=1 Tax=Lentzea sp. TaxID=56099 RepID=UPI002ED2F389
MDQGDRVLRPSAADPVRRLAHDAVDRVPPGAASFVMASGIVATSLRQQGFTAVSSALLVVAVVGLVVIVGVQVARLLSRPAEVVGDARNPGKGFGYLTLVAALDVVTAALVPHGFPALATATLSVAAVLWLVLTYGVPAALMLRTAPSPTPADVDGSWLLWVVGTQSLAIAVMAVGPGGAEVTATVAVALWGAGTVLYVVLAAIVLSRLLTAPNTRQTVTPAYWILTGATAISALAAARVLSLPAGPAILDVTAGFVAGMAIALWAFGTWWFPLLVVLGVWRYVVQRRPARYEAGLWSIVFPLGTYAAACTALGEAVRLPFLRTAGAVATIVAVAAWVATTVLMVVAARGWFRAR